jgi:hypothetical protein
MTSEPTQDYLDAVYLCMPNAGGKVLTNESGFSLTARDISPDLRSKQLFKIILATDGPHPGRNQHIRILHLQDGMAVVQMGGRIELHAVEQSSNQVWYLNSSCNIVYDGTTKTIAKTSDNRMVLSDTQGSVSQIFEVISATDCNYIRHCATGLVLTANTTDRVSWEKMDPARSSPQLWLVSPSGFLINSATARVLQLSSPVPHFGLTLNTGARMPDPNNAHQKFDCHHLDGAFHSRAGVSEQKDYVITKDATGQAVIVDYNVQDRSQVIEFLSPLQFFMLQSDVKAGGYPWMVRGGNKAASSYSPTGDVSQQFTFSRYGDLVSPVDGWILQDKGLQNVPEFVDRSLLPIDNKSTAFTYDDVPKASPIAAAIILRHTLGSSNYGLIMGKGPRQAEPWMYTTNPPVGGNQAWRLNGLDQSFLSRYLVLSRAFFANIIPFPAEPSQTPGVDLDKKYLVIAAIIDWLLYFVCGVSMQTRPDSVTTAIGDLVLNDPQTRDMVSVIVDQRTVSNDTCMAVALRIGEKGQWGLILWQFLPASYYAHVALPARLAKQIAQGVYTGATDPVYADRVTTYMVPAVRSIVNR